MRPIWRRLLAVGVLVLLGACATPATKSRTPSTDTGADGSEEGSAPAAADGGVGGAAEAAGESGTSADGAKASGSQGAPAPAPVSGPFSEDRVQEIVRAHFDKMGECYAKGLQRRPEMKGTINVSLTIDGDGAVVRATAPKSDRPKPKPKKKRKRHYWEKKKPEPEPTITDTAVVTCVEDQFKGLRFPPTGRGLVTLVYPVVFRTE